MNFYYLLLAAGGGAVGAGLRYVAGVFIAGGGFPWATFVVNVSGALAIGGVMAFVARADAGHAEVLRIFLGVGVLGGFTTFSAFSFEFLQMLERREVLLAFLYAGGSVVCGLAAAALGFWVVGKGGG